MPHARRCRSTPTDDWQQLLLLTHFTEQLTYKLIRPVVLFGQSPAARARETTAPERTPYRQLTRVAGPHTKHLCCVAAALGYMFHAAPLPQPAPSHNAGKEDDLLRFEWRREPGPSNPYPRGHLHVVPGLLASPTVIRPGDFHKAHIPTKRLSFEAVVRFAITELNVQPQQDAWETTLGASEAAFEEHKTA